MRSTFSALRLPVIWDRLRGSFWFVPTLMAAGAIVLSFSVTRLDAALDQGVYTRFELYLFGPEGARSILSAIASSMITVAGLTFSITMLTLQLASSQFGPRLLRSFMRDRGNQLVLGTFISTFVYCLLVLRTIKGVEGASFVPHLAVAIGVLLAIASLAVLIYFIHHTAHSIRIETLLASLAAETGAAIDRLYPEKLGQGPPHQADPPVPDFTRGLVVHAGTGGYVQIIDGDALLALAVRHDLVVDLVARPGAFVTERDPLMLVLPAKPLPEPLTIELRDTVVVGSERTPDQDLEFSVRRIVEIAQRSLSPGINDPTTALYCIDRLREAFERLAGRSRPSSLRLDKSGKLRVVTRPVCPQDLASRTFAAVAHYAGTDRDVLEGLAFSLGRLIEMTDEEQHPDLAALRLAIRQRLPRCPA